MDDKADVLCELRYLDKFFGGSSLGAVLSTAADEIDRLTAEVERLRGMIEQTADGVLIPDIPEDGKLYCPRCAGEVRIVIDIAYCDDCPNPDDYGVPPMPWCLSSCYSTRDAAEAASKGEEKKGA